MYEMLITFLKYYFKKRATHPCSAKFCCLQELEHGPLVLFLITSFLLSNSFAA